MGSDLVYYWENILQKNITFSLNSNSYIVNFIIVNQASNETYKNWIVLPDGDHLVNYLKYIALPSLFYSILIGTEEKTIFVNADSFNSVVNLLENNIIRDDKELSKRYQLYYNSLDKLQGEYFKFDELLEICNNINESYNEKNIVFPIINVYKNIKDVGLRLIQDYEDDNMIEELENTLNISKNDFLDMLNDINNNKFMLNKFMEYLDNKIFL